jgi:hypothetical protein
MLVIFHIDVTVTEDIFVFLDYSRENLVDHVERGPGSSEFC